ncbi:hypothetical protein BA920_05645 [Helicobacter pullorum]|uniref:hypothetical protein n=1 Tax=Helicobacter pullorum TaxID=35818 RepID=UPI000816AD8A|nr:hypothetical protein [Helicobacter pullorum]OCR05269.1 hypothetical protein BA920_05645 [Helicobacter pullorum]OCR17823.1 hypothetical protein BA919_00575 [Helicobacter pullorum]OCR19430.1 hypothetical protein BA918_03275 [Helicobacter pullorum]
MKKVSEVLSHLFSDPCYEKIYLNQQIQHFITMLPLSVRNGIKFFYFKNHTLFFVLKHPCFKQEFDYKLTIIKQLLKQYQKEKEKLLEIQNLKAFVGHNVYEKSLEISQEIPQYSYGELSSGDFINLAKNQEIYGIFERIKKLIKSNQQ